MRSRILVIAVAVAMSLLLGVRLHASTDDAPGQNGELSLYDRVGAKLAANTELAKLVGTPSVQLRQAKWLIGRWRVKAHTFKTSSRPEKVEYGESDVTTILGGTWLELSDRYSGNVQDLGFLTFNPVTNQWLALGIDRTGNAITSVAERWGGERLVFLAEHAEILGEPVSLRQTMEKRTNREYRVLNEEKLPSGAWIEVDEYIYVKRSDK